jgi:alpha-ketoglutarate-dependent taurine dioxygenase
LASTLGANESELTPVPGGWTGSELAREPESWGLDVPDDVCEELLRLARDLGADNVAMDPFQRKPAVSEHTRSLVAQVHRRLAGEPGFVVLTGFPIPEEPDLTEAVYSVFGLLVGLPIRASAHDKLLIRRVENLDLNASSNGDQGDRRSIGLPFHSDRAADMIGLLCVRPALHGGLSRWVSSKRVHNILLEEHPDLLAALYQPVPFRMQALRTPAEEEARQWCEIPIFSRVGGRFSAHYERQCVEQGQAFDDAPRLTSRQTAAIDALNEVLDRPELALETKMSSGDLQLVNNLLVLHSRTAFHGENGNSGRLMLKLQLAFAGSPGLPPEYAPLFGATDAGTYRGGGWRVGKFRDRLGTPVDAVGV